jgi:hypothetical protein
LIKLNGLIELNELRGTGCGRRASRLRILDFGFWIEQHEIASCGIEIRLSANFPRRTDLDKRYKAEGSMNSEVGPVVVPKEWDYAAARMRNVEKKENHKLSEKANRRISNNEFRRNVFCFLGMLWI